MDESTRKAALEAVFEKLAGFIDERHSIQIEITELNRRNLRIDQELADCAAAARLFGATAQEIENQIEKATNESQEIDRMDRAVTRAIRTGAVGPATPSQMPKIKDIVLDRLRAAGPSGTKAAQIREFIDMMYGSDANPIHEKTVGMSLYRLLKQGLAHRRGLIWIFGPDPSGTKNPGGDAPGPIDKLFS